LLCTKGFIGKLLALSQMGMVEDIYILILVKENIAIKMLRVDGHHLLSLSFVIKDFLRKLQGYGITIMNIYMSE
jgi:hypothetical protein